MPLTQSKIYFSTWEICIKEIQIGRVVRKKINSHYQPGVQQTHKIHRSVKLISRSDRFEMVLLTALAGLNKKHFRFPIKSFSLAEHFSQGRYFNTVVRFPIDYPPVSPKHDAIVPMRQDDDDYTLVMAEVFLGFFFQKFFRFLTKDRCEESKSI